MFRLHFIYISKTADIRSEHGDSGHAAALRESDFLSVSPLH